MHTLSRLPGRSIISRGSSSTLDLGTFWKLLVPARDFVVSIRTTREEQVPKEWERERTPEYVTRMTKDRSNVVVSLVHWGPRDCRVSKTIFQLMCRADDQDLYIYFSWIRWSRRSFEKIPFVVTMRLIIGKILWNYIVVSSHFSIIIRWKSRFWRINYVKIFFHFVIRFSGCFFQILFTVRRVLGL